ncbi:Gamma-glutamylcyclotransferase 2-3 [Sesamum angolense]|uniref:glutathione-specific gamma-glutamylcyclotransferase n=1 Tax=Sesamum angolense TaxID=2727404 RepID=A0AAE1WAD9_9LAMI|nr:Gamma-glutamylcyclotransferase 2-3 [Sesamum angolense]
MAMWVFGYGSLIWKAGFPYDERLVGFIKDYRRVFYQGSTDHRGTPEFPGRTVTLEPAKGEFIFFSFLLFNKSNCPPCCLQHLEVREKQYDKKAYVDFFTVRLFVSKPTFELFRYIASADKKQNQNYLGPASLEDIAVQIVKAEGPSGPNREYLFKLENALIQIGCEDKHVIDLANEVRRILSLQGELTV